MVLPRHHERRVGDRHQDSPAGEMRGPGGFVIIMKARKPAAGKRLDASGLRSGKRLSGGDVPQPAPAMHPCGPGGWGQGIVETGICHRLAMAGEIEPAAFQPRANFRIAGHGIDRNGEQLQREAALQAHAVQRRRKGDAIEPV